MKSFAELPRNEKRLELLRWTFVLPAALLASLVVKVVLGLLIHLAVRIGLFTPGTSELLYYLQVLVVYVPKMAAFVIAGAMMAPRARLATTIVLMFAAILMSLVVHIFGQTTVGILNYAHCAAESLGAIAGAVVMAIYESHAKPRIVADL